MNDIAPADIVEILNEATPIAWARCRPFKYDSVVVFGLPLMAWKYDINRSTAKLLAEIDKILTDIVETGSGEVQWVFKIRQGKPNRSLYPELLDDYLQTGNFHSDSEAIEAIDSQQPNYVSAAIRDLPIIKTQLMKKLGAKSEGFGSDP